MRQEFNGTAQGQFSSRDIINIHTPPSDMASDDEPLLQAQRQRLHQLLDDIIAVSGESKKDLWRAVHAHIDVPSIHNITTRKYHKAEEYLLQRLADAKQARECRRLVGEILRLTTDKVMERDRFCLRRFGTKTLNDLSREQLQIAFDHFDGDELPHCQPEPIQAKQVDWQELIKTHPKVFIGVFLLGFFTSFLFR
ncbi:MULTISPECIES: hypothetical protein [Brenneria]|uniref:Flagella biosynthesis regulator Flk n=1 Tax=Brenneria nigrifluens DSM 30175 = ATCC 13028 TaxID=1121120 RepID=A0A2U1UWF3_9GAMM|nr:MULTISPECIES: hypothetical protein [Brenneria]EHD22628.1 hypothetical protein BrE312_3263 [Brenneria sp. EniD312]PWC26005.1 hypothetical protein DDT54_01380 [Brenneria nigrifluens DSM 30175 = ATCC 13028]QCR05613.1 hypothetical protein EH206_16340 [Brenneria nigrifluens DSM 30175 = ATCC 13028]